MEEQTPTPSTPSTTETFLAELQRYVRWSAEDEAALRALAPFAEPHFARIAEEFSARAREHAGAERVFAGPEQIERHQQALREWMKRLLEGPWDESYHAVRARIGHAHVQVGLPQRYMFVGMSFLHDSLLQILATAPRPLFEPLRTSRALAKVLDLELAIMLETYREAYLEKAQRLERLERQGLEQRLAISEARYREIVESTDALIATFDETGRISLFNRACGNATGVLAEAAIGRNWTEVFVGELERTLVDGLLAKLRSGRKTESYEGFIPGAPPRRARWHFTRLPSTCAPLFCAIGIDTTEEHQLGARTRRSERLAALGTMAAGLAHEIRNPLNGAHLQLTLMRRRLSKTETEDRQTLLDSAALVEEELKRLALLVEEFLQFARPHALALARGDLRETVKRVVTLLEPEAREAGIALSLLPAEAAIADFDDERLKQVTMNLVRNAIEAVGAGGRVDVAVERQEAAAVLRVEDNGPGLSSPDAPLFEPFFTTKEKGTGLGLAIVHRIVADHGGTVQVESKPGKTTFTVVLPAPHRLQHG